MHQKVASAAIIAADICNPEHILADRTATIYSISQRMSLHDNSPIENQIHLCLNFKSYGRFSNALSSAVVFLDEDTRVLMVH